MAARKLRADELAHGVRFVNGRGYTSTSLGVEPAQDQPGMVIVAYRQGRGTQVRTITVDPAQMFFAAHD